MTGRIKRGIGFIIIGHLLLATGLLSGAMAGDWGMAAASRMKQWLEPRSLSLKQGCSDQSSNRCADLIRFYQSRNYRLAWLDPNGLLPEGVMAMEAVRQAGTHGLLSSDYLSPRLDDQLDGLKTMPVVSGPGFDRNQVQLDLALTDMMLRYAHDRTMGRAAPNLLTYGKQAKASQCRDLAGELAEALTKDRLAGFLETLGPANAGYLALQKSLQRYRQIRSHGGWSVIDEGPPIQLGDCSQRVAQLKDRLAPPSIAPFASQWMQACFDKHLAAEVKQFQHRHGLKADGVVGAKTLHALNVPVDQRIRQIQLNLERWRWMPEQPGFPYIRVNIPGYQVQIVEADRVVKTMRAIVGQKRRPTPLLSSMLTYLEVNPYWHVPSRIARLDLLPKIQEDPYYLIRQNFRVFDGWDEHAQEIDPHAIDWSSFSKAHFPFRLRQEPDSRNALGRVKFMFPNELSVYIHDTPSKSLFNKSSRHFSSGCVRVEEPLELMTYLLKREDWDEERLSKLLASEQRQVVVLEQPVPVYLVYLTAWVEENGEIHFREDIYGHDQQLSIAMAKNMETRPTCIDAMVQPDNLVQNDHAKHSTL